MNIQQHLRYIAVFLAVGTLALPIAAEACHRCEGTTCYTKISGASHHCWKHKHKHHWCCKEMCRMDCQIKPAHWWGSTWYSESKECWFVR